MSFFAQAWAETAPVANVHERAILTFLAHRAGGKDGSGAWPAVKSMADFAVCSVRQAQNVLEDLQERGLIQPGDPRINSHVPANRRPKVWDLMIPYEWFGKPMLEEVNAERKRAHRDPITPEERPPIGPVERRPAGRRKPKTAPASDSE